MADMFSMSIVREHAKFLCETFELDSFSVMLKCRGLEKVIPYIDAYTKAGWITPIEVKNKKRFHRGHLLTLLQLSRCNVIDYLSGLGDSFDFEDLFSRRAFVCDLKAKNVRTDVEHIERFFSWLWSDNPRAFIPADAVHTKAIIEQMLDEIDPKQFFENLQVPNSDGTYKLVHELIDMQSDIEELVGLAADAGMQVTNAAYLVDRKLLMEEIESMMNPLRSHFLAVPNRDMQADERMDFLRERNQLLADRKYKDLIDFYEAHSYLYDSDPQKHAELAVCMGYIYGDLLKDSEKAAAAFQEALEYDASNTEAFSEISRHLREAEKWDELVELQSNHWDTIEDAAERCALILECAQIQAFKCQNISESLGLFERCMLEGHPGNCFDILYKIIAGLMSENTNLEKMRALVTLTLHITSYSQCDKVEALQKEFSSAAGAKEPFGLCLSKLIDAGLQSFKGDQPQALETLREAIVYSPSTNLIDGMLLRIASKMHSVAEFREAIDDLESDSLSSKDLSNIWMRIAKVLLKLGNWDEVVLEYAEKAVSCDSDNNEAIDICYNMAMRLSKPERAFIYASLKAARTKNPSLKSEIENTCRELKLSFGDDDDKLMGAYETLLTFDELKEGVSDGIRELMTSVSNEKAVSILQRVEAKCMASGMSVFVGELYRLVLEREYTTDVKKGLLERYLGCMLGQGPALDLDEFITIHAQRYALGPSDHLFLMFKNTARDNEYAMIKWTGCLEDAVADIEDKTRIAKIQMTLATCYQSYLKDNDKAADAFASLLKVAPDNVPAFKCCYKSFEDLERYFDCVEIAKTFPFEKLSQQERLAYSLKSLSFSVIYLYDTKAMKYFIDIIAKDDENTIPRVLDHIIEEAVKKDVEKDQLICFLEKIEEEESGLTALALHLARVRMLIEESRFDEVVPLITKEIKEQAKKYKLEPKFTELLSKLDKEDETLKPIFDIWFAKPEKPAPLPAPAPISAPATSTSATPSSTSSSIEALVQECAEKIDDDSFQAVVDGALKTLSTAEQGELCVKLGALYEKNNRIQQAEDYFKRAFGFTQSYELLEFYKRNRLFKRAIKIMNFKIQHTPEDGRNAARMELANLYERSGNFKNAILVLDDILLHKDKLDKKAIVEIMRKKAADLVVDGRCEEAINALANASAEIPDVKQREEIDIDRCFLMRENAPADAKKLQQSLILRGAKSEKMSLLNLCFDIDAEKYTEATSKIDNLLKSDNVAIKIPVLEQKLRMQEKRGDSSDMLHETANELLALSPEHPAAKAALSK
ncbi:MAG: hypothetical protein IJU23_03665 [Proteobacteria bacterium]|nr:hypothetical protein [Pseudomonadota bacterium]